MNKITLLGSGDTLGTPLAGCNSASCVDTDSRSKRYRFGLLIEINGKKILIDTNPDLKWQCLQSNFELEEIDYILITHTHSDHLNGMGEFFYRRKVPTKTYYLDHPLIRKHIDHFRYLENEKILEFKQYKVHKSFKLNADITVTPVELSHNFPCCGFVIKTKDKKIGIVSDTNFNLPTETIEVLKGCDFLFVDAFSEDLEQVKKVYLDCGIDVPNLETEWFHMTFPETKKLQEVTQSKILYAIHLSRFVQPHKKLVEKYQTDNFIIGFDNLVFDF